MPSLNEENRISTYCQDTVYPVPEAEDEDHLMRQFGRRVADTVIATDKHAIHKRAELVENMCADEFT